MGGKKRKLEQVSAESEDFVLPQIPDRFRCPITGDIMRDPVSTSEWTAATIVEGAAAECVGEGSECICFERHAIQDWVRKGNTTYDYRVSATKRSYHCVTDTKLMTQLTPNVARRNAIDEYLQEYPKVAAFQAARQHAQEQVSTVGPTASGVPVEFIDNISYAIMQDPVIAQDGCSYERSTIKAWIADSVQRDVQLVSPTVGRKPMGPELKDNTDLKKQIEKFFIRLQSADGCSPETALELPDQDNDPIESIRSLNRIFASLDQLEDLLHQVLDGWEAPRIVTIGTESSGKSTLLERLCMMPLFPHDASVCTRMPVRISVRRSPTQLPPTLEVWNTVTNQRIGNARPIPLTSGDIDIKEEMDKIVKSENENKTLTGVCTTFEIRITVLSPSLPPMNLLDLPGVVQQPALVARQTRQLVSNTVKDHKKHNLSMFLVVVPATQSARESAAITLVTEHNVTDRCIGVITKCDKFSDVDELKLLRKRLENKDADITCPLQPHGYVATMNKTVSSDASNHDKLLQQARAEPVWFREQARMGDQVDLGLATTRTLSTKLNCMYLKHVVESWIPQTLTKLTDEKKRIQTQDEALGVPAASGDLENAALSELRSAAQECVSALLKPCCGAGMRRFVKGTLAVIKSKLSQSIKEFNNTMPLGVGEDFDGEMSLNTLRDELKQNVHSACSIEAMQAEWTESISIVLKNGGGSFKLQRFPSFVNDLVQALSTKAAPNWHACMKDRVDQTIDECIQRNSNLTTISVNIVGGETAKCSINISNNPVCDLILFTLANCFCAAKTSRVDSAAQEVAECTFLKDHQAKESCHGERSRLKVRMSKLDDAIGKLQQIVEQPINSLAPKQADEFRGGDEEHLLQRALLASLGVEH